MQVPVLVFEKQREVEILMKALHHEREIGVKSDEEKVKYDAILHELFKINKIYETTNNS